MNKTTNRLTGTAALCLSAALALWAATVTAEDWYPSKYGADDTIGAANNLSADAVKNAAGLVKLGKTYALGVPTGPDTPAYPPRWYHMTVLQLGASDGATLGSNKATSYDDLLTTYMGVGSQIDGLGHMGVDHVYYNGTKAADFAGPAGLTKFSTHEIPPIVSRGVLLDMTRQFDADPLPAGTAFNRKEIDAAAKRAGVTIGKGDVVLFHTGWLSKADIDPDNFIAQQPGLGLEGARYLAGLGVVAVGADTAALEAIPHEDPDMAFPVHAELLAKNGVYILEVMNTSELAADGATEFLFVLGQPRFVGSVQAIINPIAIR
jgi:kynurenine formamidase